jgi:hypothetical protein
MSTLQVTRRPRRRITRLRTRLLAVSALIAIGATAVILALTGANHATTTKATAAAAATVAHPNCREISRSRRRFPGPGQSRVPCRPNPRRGHQRSPSKLLPRPNDA